MPLVQHATLGTRLAYVVGFTWSETPWVERYGNPASWYLLNGSADCEQSMEKWGTP
jgi:hypothetical protein